MANITAKQVKELRETTGAGASWDAKKALVEARGRHAKSYRNHPRKG